MKMTSMKLPKSKKGEKLGDTAAYVDKDEYPYGLKINLNEDQIKKLGNLFDGADVEGKVMIQAEAYVASKESREQKGGKPERSLGIQITALSCSPVDKEEEDTGWYDNMKAEKK